MRPLRSCTSRDEGLLPPPAPAPAPPFLDCGLVNPGESCSCIGPPFRLFRRVLFVLTRSDGRRAKLLALRAPAPPARLAVHTGFRLLQRASNAATLGGRGADGLHTGGEEEAAAALEGGGGALTAAD